MFIPKRLVYIKTLNNISTKKQAPPNIQYALNNKLFISPVTFQGILNVVQVGNNNNNNEPSRQERIQLCTNINMYVRVLLTKKKKEEKDKKKKEKKKRISLRFGRILIKPILTSTINHYHHHYHNNNNLLISLINTLTDLFYSPTVFI